MIQWLEKKKVDRVAGGFSPQKIPGTCFAKIGEFP